MGLLRSGVLLGMLGGLSAKGIQEGSRQSSSTPCKTAESQEIRLSPAEAKAKSIALPNQDASSEFSMLANR